MRSGNAFHQPAAASAAPSQCCISFSHLDMQQWALPRYTDPTRQSFEALFRVLTGIEARRALQSQCSTPIGKSHRKSVNNSTLKTIDEIVKLTASHLSNSLCLLTPWLLSQISLTMDINKWLESTVLPQQEPSLPEQLGLPPFLHPKENYKALLASTDKQPRKRRHTTSDSSFLETRQHNQTSPIEHEVEIDNKSNDKLLTDASSSSDRSSLVGYASGHPYGRKPRHKTRPDIYEPKSDQVKERGMQRHRRGKGESKKTKGKSRRKKTEKPGIGLVQSFHARNVPKGRLTVRYRSRIRSGP